MFIILHKAKYITLGYEHNRMSKNNRNRIGSWIAVFIIFGPDSMVS